MTSLQTSMLQMQSAFEQMVNASMSASSTSRAAGAASSSSSRPTGPAINTTGFVVPQVLLERFVSAPKPGSHLATAIEHLQTFTKRPDSEQQSLRALSKAIQPPGPFSDNVASWTSYTVALEGYLNFEFSCVGSALLVPSSLVREVSDADLQQALPGLPSALNVALFSLLASSTMDKPKLHVLVACQSTRNRAGSASAV